MRATFIHVSDIHFGQERGSEFVVHDDVRECLVKDAKLLAQKYADNSVTGILVTGDIAYGGRADEYTRAGIWLDKLAAAAGCVKTAVQIVPGNHDIDWAEISSGCKMMLQQIFDSGEDKLDAFLANSKDREVLYGRFSAYRPFAEGYDCPMDTYGGLSKDRTIELAPGRTIRFVGLNTALICSDRKDEEGNLLLGNRQRVLPRNDGEELVVLAHHPLHWLRDSDKARKYIKSRARVLITGHEHDPKLNIDVIKPGTDLMMLAAGATVPPYVTDEYTYTYNLLIFEWDEKTDGLKVTIVPRAWSEEETDFIDDDVRLGGHAPSITLGCPYFRVSSTAPAKEVTPPGAAPENPVKIEDVPESVTETFKGEDMTDVFALVLLKFFRDLTPSQRIAVLVEMNALPEDWRDPLTHSIERTVVDGLAKAGRTTELDLAIDRYLKSDDKNGEG